MKLFPGGGIDPSMSRKVNWLAAGASLLIWAGVARAQATANLTIWDTGVPVPAGAQLENRAGWIAIPSELFTFEEDPPKASSDPGYYGREYSFKGDTVIENRSVAALVSKVAGRVILYSKDGAGPGGTLVAEVSPLESGTQPLAIRSCEVLRNAGDQAIVRVSFAGSGSADQAVTIALGRNNIIEVKPGAKLKGLHVRAPVAYGVVPSFVGDDLIFDPADYPSTAALHLPNENMLVGLLRGEGSMLVATWPKGKQRVSLGLAELQGARAVESIDVETDGQPIYLAALSAPGIWHREDLKPTYLEKDVAVAWKRPFPARWKTELVEAGVTTTYRFRPTKGEIWRGVPGSYVYPVWFEGETASYHLSKKVPPKGQSLIYFLEAQNTPVDIPTPADILETTLGRGVAGEILDLEGRKLRTHHRRGGDGVHRACTCGCTDAIQEVFEAKQENARKDYIAGAVEDMEFFVRCHVSRIDEYRRFADELSQYLNQQAAASPELKPFLDNLQEVAEQIPHECEVQKENMKSPAFMEDLQRRTLALAGKEDPDNLKAYMQLLKAWRGMGGSQDYVVAQCHDLTRKLAQQAGYGCVQQPTAVTVTEEVRRRCRQILRNPDGYEIWADY